MPENEAPPLNPLDVAPPADVEESAAEVVAEEALSEAAEKPQELPDWSKPVQQIQQTVATLKKEMGKIAEAMRPGPGAKTETPQQVASSLARAKALLTGQSRKDLDTYMPGMGDALEDLVTGMESRGSVTDPEDLKEFKALKAELEYKAYFADYPQTYRLAFEKEQNKVMDEEGLTGPELRGYMTHWFKHYVATKAATAKETGTPARAASGAGANRVIPATTAPRRTAAPDPKGILQSGRGGNIGGVPFKK